MKNIILIVILLSNIVVFSQDIIDPPKLKSLADTAIYDRDYNSKHYITGWNWSTEGKPSNTAMLIQPIWDFIPLGLVRFPSSLRVIIMHPIHVLKYVTINNVQK